LNNGLKLLGKVLDFSAYLIANRTSWQQKDLSEVMGTLENVQLEREENLAAGVKSINPFRSSSNRQRYGAAGFAGRACAKTHRSIIEQSRHPDR